MAVVYELNNIVKVTLYDEPLYAVVPGGKFSFNSKNKIVMEQNFSCCAQNLCSIVIAGIEKRKQPILKLPTMLAALSNSTAP